MIYITHFIKINLCCFGEEDEENDIEDEDEKLSADKDECKESVK